MDVNGLLIGRDAACRTASPAAGEVRVRFHAHGVGSVRVPAGVKPADLLAVVRLLAAEPTEASVESFVRRLPVEAALAILVDGPRQLPQAHDMRTLDNLSAPIGGRPRGGASTDAGAAPTRSCAPRPRPMEPDPLRDIELQADLAYRREEWEELLGVATRILRLEAAEKDESRHRRYSVTLRRILPKSALQHIARAALAEGRRADATAVLKRMGADAVEALLELLTAAPTLAERRGYFSVLTKMEAGTERIVTPAQPSRLVRGAKRGGALRRAAARRRGARVERAVAPPRRTGAPRRGGRAGQDRLGRGAGGAPAAAERRGADGAACRRRRAWAGSGGGAW